MKNTYQLKLTYPERFSLHHITTLLESVNGVRIQHLNVVGKGHFFVGFIVVEARELLQYNLLLQLLRARREFRLEA